MRQIQGVLYLELTVTAHKLALNSKHVLKSEEYT